MNISLRSPSAQRGSLLLVAMLLTTIIGISIVSYLALARTGMTVSNRSLYVNAAMNLAENGMEEAVYSINKYVSNSSYNWSGAGWATGMSANTRQKWTGVTFDQNATGETRAYIYGYKTSAPRIVTRSLVTLKDNSGAPVEKWILVQLRKTSKFSNGLVAKDSITFKGNTASVDSWDSDPDNNSATAAIAYSTSVKNDNGSVGSISVAVDAVLVNNADIWGYAATGGSLPSVGANGLVGPFGTSSGTMDPSHVSTDFAASFDPVTVPTNTFQTVSTVSITTSLSLPEAGDTVDADGYYYIEADSVDFNNETLTITDKVVLNLTNTSNAIKIGGGSGQVTIAPGAELIIYAEGTIDIAGNGVLNGGSTLATANQPKNFQIYGTKTSGTQDITIVGNGVLSGVIYAPNGSVDINGNGDVLGSVVANDITLVGNALFHYDESLADMDAGDPFRVSRWMELTTSAQRAVYSSDLTW